MSHKKILITGASSGIGKELALILAKDKYELILVGRNHARLQQVLEAVRKTSVAESIQADLSSREGVLLVCSEISRLLPDVVINNAGMGFYGEVISHSQQEALEIISTNCSSVVAISQAYAKCMIEKGRQGTILNVSSCLSFVPCPLAAVYAASKGFINQFSKALDFELEPHGIRVLVACPGQVATEFRARASKGKTGITKNDMVLNSHDVAKAIWRQIVEQKPLQIINWRYRLFVMLTKILPESVVKKWLEKTLRGRI